MASRVQALSDGVLIDLDSREAPDCETMVGNFASESGSRAPIVYHSVAFFAQSVAQSLQVLAVILVSPAPGQLCGQASRKRPLDDNVEVRFLQMVNHHLWLM